MLRSLLTTLYTAIAIGFIVVVYLFVNLPATETLKDVRLQVPLKIYSADGSLLAEYGEKRRTPIELKAVPKDLINAILATEDRRFYQHPGVDWRGLVRAAVRLVSTGNKEQGGSTITMQVARNFFFSRKKTYLRKMNEILLALRIERELTKDEILELYLNKIYFGKRAYGIAAAAEVYYGTSVDKLNLAQMAMLAGLPQAPSAINPLNNPQAAYKRRKHVLERMLAYGFINEDHFQHAIETPLSAQYHGRQIELDAPYVAEMARQELHEKYGDNIYSAGYELYTTIDSKMQQAANNALRTSLFAYDERHGFRSVKKHLELSEERTAEQELSIWQQELEQLDSVGGLTPGIVTSAEGKSIWVLQADMQLLEIPWQGLSWARKVRPSGRLGPKPKQASDIVEVGDVVYTRKTKQGLRLAQIPEIEGAMVAMHPDTGKILALVGGFDFKLSGFNRATQAERQPGSSFKPFVYAAALENGFTPASIINDAPIVQAAGMGETDWRPQNHTKTFYGPTRLRIGLTTSRNLVSIRLLQAVGIDKTIDFIKRFGFDETQLPRGLSLALGTSVVTPLELARAYCVFPNGGHLVNPHITSHVEEYSGKLVRINNQPRVCSNDRCPTDTNEHHPIKIAPRVLDPRVAYTMTSLLQEALRTGTAHKARSLGRRDLAGKTGTTSDWHDTWYAGYNRDVVVTTWVGFDEPKSVKEYAVRAALPMWIQFVKEAIGDTPDNAPPQPPGLVTVRIDPETGLLARKGQVGVYELFMEELVPKRISTHVDNSQESGTQSKTPEPPTIESLF